MKLILFEDDQYERFLPLCWVRAVFELKTGATTLAAKIERAAGRAADAVLVRDYLAAVVRRRTGTAVNDLAGCRGEEVLFVNARVRGSDFKPPAGRAALWKGDQLAVWRTTADVSGIRDYAGLVAAARAAGRTEYSGGWFDYIWDVMLANPQQIAADFAAAGRRGIEGQMSPHAVIYGPADQVFVGEKTEIHPFVCLDTRNGPITIEAGCEVHPFTRVEGPCYVGAKSILLGAKVREGCSIGPMCRIGGEVEESIIHGHSNKYHDGFLGHAYVGQWVNLGALTTNSDLKNDYSDVSIMLDGKKAISTGSIKVGSLIGDHTKTSIGTLLNSGAYVGSMALVAATGKPLPKFIPSFAWFLEGVVTKGFGRKQLYETARKSMGRRKKAFTPAQESMWEEVFRLTAPARDEAVKKGRRALAAHRQG